MIPAAAAAASWTLGVIVLSALVQQPAVGSAAPLLPVRDLDGTHRSLRDLAGPRGLVIVFWAGWSDRSIEELKRLATGEQTLRSQGVGIAAVNVEHEVVTPDDVKVLSARLSALGGALPVVVDEGLELFHAYGVVTVPTTVLVNEKGDVAYFASGYSHSGREDLFDAIAVLAGAAPRASTGTTPAAAPAALRRLQLGRSALSRDRVDTARSSFEAAAAADPAFVDPIVELAALALDDGDVARAGALLDRAQSLRPDDAAARRERGRAVAIEGRPTDAVAALEPLAASVPDPVTFAYLGFLHRAAGRHEAADAAFGRAVQSGGLDPRVAVGTVAGDDAAAAMMRYRRANGLPGR